MLKFTQEHEWVRVEGDVATVGITQYAQEQLGDLVFIGCQSRQEPCEGRGGGRGKSVKAASEVYTPISGEVVEANPAIVSDPSLVNSDPMGAGWFFKLKLANFSQVDALLDEAAYKELLGMNYV